MLDLDGDIITPPNACTLNAGPDCTNDGLCTRIVDCPAVVQLPFFGFAQLISTMVIIGLIYLVFVTRKR